MFIIQIIPYPLDNFFNNILHFLRTAISAFEVGMTYTIVLRYSTYHMRSKVPAILMVCLHTRTKEGTA